MTFRRGTHVEPDDDGVGSRSQQDVGFRDRAGAAVDDVDADLFRALLVEGIHDGFEGALHVGLDDEVEHERFLIVRLAGQEGFEGHAGLLGEFAFTQLDGAAFRDAAGQLFVLKADELLTGFRHAFKALHFHRNGRPGLFDLAALVVEHGAHAAAEHAAHEGVALMERAFLDEHGRHGAAALVELGFHDVAASRLVRVGREFEDVGLEGQHFEHFVEAFAGLGGNLTDHGVPAPVFGHEAEGGEFLKHAVRVGRGLVHLVDRNHDWHAGGAGVVHGFAGLFHDAVVGGDDQHHKVGHLRAAGTHGGERFVAGRVEEHDFAALGLHVVRADVLRDAARFAAGQVASRGWRRAARSCRGRRGP